MCPVQPPDPGGAGPEGDLRQQRYAVFEAVLEPGDVLLQAHHRDDQAETLLLNLMRGSGPQGLAGIPESRPLGRGRVLRPLLDVRRADLQAYLEERGVTWIEDPGNADPAYDRGWKK